MNDLQTLRFFCTNEHCHFEWKRVTNVEQTAQHTCPQCGSNMQLEES